MAAFGMGGASARAQVMVGDVRNVAAHTLWSNGKAHTVTVGGPRGADPGSHVSMQIIRPCLHSGQSRKDTPVSRW
jgi:hypothetical protein